MALKFPAAAEGYSIRVTDYYGNEEDGFYSKGERVLIAVYKKIKIFFWTPEIRVSGLPGYIVNPALGEEKIQKSIDELFAKFQAKERGKIIAAQAVAASSSLRVR